MPNAGHRFPLQRDERPKISRPAERCSTDRPVFEADRHAKVEPKAEIRASGRWKNALTPRLARRAAIGWKMASPTAVLRDDVRLIAATATRLRPPTVREMGRVRRSRWKELRQRLDQRRQARLSARNPAATQLPISPDWSSNHANQLW
jgi:hypothetical protein